MMFLVLFVLLFSFCVDASITFSYRSNDGIEKQIKFEENDPIIKTGIFQTFFEHHKQMVQVCSGNDEKNNKFDLGETDFQNLSTITVFLNKCFTNNSFEIPNFCKPSALCFLLGKYDYYYSHPLSDEFEQKRNDEIKMISHALYHNLNAFSCHVTKNFLESIIQKGYSIFIQEILRDYILFHTMSQNFNNFVEYIVQDQFQLNKQLKHGRLSGRYAWSETHIINCHFDVKQHNKTYLFPGESTLLDMFSNTFLVFNESCTFDRLDDCGEMSYQGKSYAFFCFLLVDPGYSNLYKDQQEIIDLIPNLVIRFVDKNNHSDPIIEECFVCEYAKNNFYIINRKGKKSVLFFDQNVNSFVCFEINQFITDDNGDNSIESALCTACYQGERISCKKVDENYVVLVDYDIPITRFPVLSSEGSEIIKKYTLQDKPYHRYCIESQPDLTVFYNISDRFILGGMHYIRPYSYVLEYCFVFMLGGNSMKRYDPTVNVLFLPLYCNDKTVHNYLYILSNETYYLVPTKELITYFLQHASWKNETNPVQVTNVKKKFGVKQHIFIGTGLILLLCFLAKKGYNLYWKKN